MTKLSNIKPSLSGLSHSIGLSPKDEKERSAIRNERDPWRAWYGTARWSRLRKAVLLRDNYKCRKTGVLLIGKHPAPNSPVVDHIQPHRGNAELFWDEGNLQAVSRLYHNGQKQKEEQKEIKGVWY